MKRILSIDS